jgi:hypothetical protein
MHSSLIDARAAARVAARLEFLEEDPLDFWDFGMVFAFDVVARKLQDLPGRDQVVTAATVLKLVAEEREAVIGCELHTSCACTEKTADEPRIAWAARMAAARSARKGRQRPAGRPMRMAPPLARAVV